MNKNENMVDKMQQLDDNLRDIKDMVYCGLLVIVSILIYLFRPDPNVLIHIFGLCVFMTSIVRIMEQYDISFNIFDKSGKEVVFENPFNIKKTIIITRPFEMKDLLFDLKDGEIKDINEDGKEYEIVKEKEKEKEE